MFSRTYTPPVSVAPHPMTQREGDMPLPGADSESLDLLLRAALSEDVGAGDVTTAALDTKRRAAGSLIASTLR